MTMSLSTVLLLLSSCVLKYLQSTELVILHTNDIHCRYDETNESGSRCTSNTNCFGGILRLSQAIKSIREREQNVVLFDGGDVLTGTLWYLTYQGKASGKFLKELNYDAVVPGNHDFDGGPSKTRRYYNDVISNGKTTVVASNIKPLSTQWDIIKSRDIIYVNNRTRIGICGATTKATERISNPGNNIRFLDEIDSIRNCSHTLKDDGVNIIIALVHAGIEMDLKIAREIEEVDIVVGGHSNTFLYTGTPPSIEKPYGPYPMLVQSRGNRKKAVVQAYAYGKYLGFLKCNFNKKGDLVGCNGNPILLNETIPKDSSLKNLTDTLRTTVDKLANEYLGKLDFGEETPESDCRKEECLFGNLVTDAMRFVSNATIALITSNTWKHSVEKRNVTYGDLADALPYQNNLITITIKGKFIKEVLKISASCWTKGHFLQVSGIKVTYDLLQKNTLSSVQVVQTEGHTLKDLRDNEEYKVVVSNYMYLYDTYKILRNNSTTSSDMQIKEVDAVKKFIQSHKPLLRINKNGRITVIRKEKKSGSICKNGLHYLFFVGVTILHFMNSP